MGVEIDSTNLMSINVIIFIETYLNNLIIRVGCWGNKNIYFINKYIKEVAFRYVKKVYNTAGEEFVMENDIAVKSLKLNEIIFSCDVVLYKCIDSSTT